MNPEIAKLVQEFGNLTNNDDACFCIVDVYDGESYKLVVEYYGDAYEWPQANFTNRAEAEIFLIKQLNQMIHWAREDNLG